jgi:hypothetical protein
MLHSEYQIRHQYIYRYYYHWYRCKIWIIHTMHTVFVSDIPCAPYCFVGFAEVVGKGWVTELTVFVVGIPGIIESWVIELVSDDVTPQTVVTTESAACCCVVCGHMTVPVSTLLMNLKNNYQHWWISPSILVFFFDKTRCSRSASVHLAANRPRATSSV